MSEQQELNLNPPPKPGELFKHGTQLYQIYEKLLSGGITSPEIRNISGSLSHTRRISDIRTKLHPRGWDVESKRLHGNVFINKLKDIRNN
jgi:hypothetical protein